MEIWPSLNVSTPPPGIHFPRSATAARRHVHVRPDLPAGTGDCGAAHTEISPSLSTLPPNVHFPRSATVARTCTCTTCPPAPGLYYEDESRNRIKMHVHSTLLTNNAQSKEEIRSNFRRKDHDLFLALWNRFVQFASGEEWASLLCFARRRPRIIPELWCGVNECCV